MTTQTLTIRKPNINDGKRIWKLVRECEPLDVNSSYLYLLLCQHFSDTCLVAERDGEFIGFVSAYIPPKKQDVLFVWQIAVHAKARGEGLAKSLLHKLLKLAGGKIRFIEATVSPSNEASKKLFHSLAKDLEVSCKQNEFFTKDFFPEDEEHEDEVLFQIGPIDKS